MTLPKDPALLLSVVNTKLRDNFQSLDDLARAYMTDKQTIIDALAKIDYVYDPVQNQFK